MFNGFDGLMMLSRREGVDIRPTLLRVLTDLYVQTPNHTRDEERQFVELASRLIDAVDDATLAAVRARLSIYPHTPREIAWKLRLKPVPAPRQPAPEETFELDPAADLEIVSEPEASLVPTMSMQPDDAAKLIALFLETDGRHRAQFLHGLATTPLKPSTPVDPKRGPDIRTQLRTDVPDGPVEPVHGDDDGRNQVQ